MATIKFLKRVRNMQQVYSILKFIRDKASRYGYSSLWFEDGSERSYGLIVADRFRTVFRRTENGEYVSGGDFQTADLKLLKAVYVILRSIRANVEASLLREELAEIAFAEAEIEPIKMDEEEARESKTETEYRRGQMTLDEVV